MNILYISYDGMLEPLGQSQVLAYLEKNQSPGLQFWLISFEKSSYQRDAELRDDVKNRIDRAGIRWIPRRYHKKPPVLSTVWDIF